MHAECFNYNMVTKNRSSYEHMEFYTRKITFGFLRIEIKMKKMFRDFMVCMSKWQKIYFMKAKKYSKSIKIEIKITYIRGLYVRVTWNVFTSISVQSCSPITLSPVCDGMRASLIACSSIISFWLSFNIFSTTDCWSTAVVIRTIFTVFIISRECDLHGSTAAVAVERLLSIAPFSLLRRDETRYRRCLSLDEFLRRLGNRFTDSALALKPAAGFKEISLQKMFENLKNQKKPESK